MKYYFAIAVLVLVNACTLQPTIEFATVSNSYDKAEYQIKSAGFIGCAPDDIAISNLVSLNFGASKAWQASCKNTRFYCSNIVKDHQRNHTSQVACTQALE